MESEMLTFKSLETDTSIDARVRKHRRSSAPARLQSCAKQESKLNDTNVIDNNLRALYGDNRSLVSNRNRATINHHYYPEGDWGFVIIFCVAVVHAITAGVQYSFGSVFQYFYWTKSEALIIITMKSVIIGSLSTAVTLFLSPVIIALCRRKSIRLIAIMGGLVTALGCFFTSFATQFHQLFISYGLIVGLGVAMTRDTAVVMIGQYFKKRREFIEIFVIGSTGVGVAVMPYFISYCIRYKNWRFGFQLLALITFMTFFMAILYRPASLYHPQRRAILHLKNLAKRTRMKEQLKAHSAQKQGSIGKPTIGITIEKPPYFDFSVLKSRTIQILICGTCISSFGTLTPLLLMVRHGEAERIEYTSLMKLQAFMGIGMIMGSTIIGYIIVKNSVECMIARQYLCQASCFMLSATILAFTALDDYSGYLLFVWIYGFFYGGYQYSLKMFIYEKVRARNFNRAWAFVQFSQSIPVIVGITISAFLNEHFGDRSGYYLSSVCIAFGSMLLFFIDAHKKRVAQKRKISSISTTGLGVQSSRRCSQDPNLKLHKYVATLHRSTDSLADLNSNRLNGSLQRLQTSSHAYDFIKNSRLRSNSIFSSTIGVPVNGELTCISEEMVLDNYVDDLILDDCITSCNKEEKYLMLSEFENNLNNISDEAAAIIKRRRDEKSLCNDKAIVRLHEAHCPMAAVVADNNRLTTSSFQSTSFATRQRRASFAGITANASKDVYPLSVCEQKEHALNHCPNCGDKIAADMEANHIVEEEETEDNNADKCDYNL